MPTTRIAAFAVLAAAGSVASAAHAEGDIHRVQHVIILMQENHSFDNYFGVLPYAPGNRYHPGPCNENDHACVDGLTCRRSGLDLVCRDSNLDDDGSTVTSFHLRNYCPRPDLDHEWPGSHREANFTNPALTRLASPNDGFVRVNDETEQHDTTESPTEDETMGYYDHTDLPFYYGLAQTFAISDRYFSSVIGPTFPNRSYGMAATSFGHLTTNEIFPPPGGYKPITGTIMDLLDRGNVSWINFFSDLPTTAIFRVPSPQHALPIQFFFALATPTTCALPDVSFVDPTFGFSDPTAENDEHPPTDIRKGQSFVSHIVNALRASKCWTDSVLFLTYDEHGGFYDHVAPPLANQGGARNPDGIDPGQCADLSAPPASTEPGGGANCQVFSPADAAAICPGFTQTGPYPAFCANFDQLGFRVPFVAVSPFSRRQYVSHRVADHTSLLAFIEKRFSSGGHLTARDEHAWTLEDLFDFDKAPSANAPVPPETAPLGTCSP